MIVAPTDPVWETNMGSQLPWGRTRCTRRFTVCVFPWRRGAEVFDSGLVRLDSAVSPVLLVVCLRVGYMFKLLILNSLCMTPQFHPQNPQNLFWFGESVVGTGM